MTSMLIMGIGALFMYGYKGDDAPWRTFITWPEQLGVEVKRLLVCNGKFKQDDPAATGDEK